MGGPGLPERDWIADALREVLGGGELSERKQARVEGNRARHHLLAVTLNAFARLGQGAELTELEQGTVDQFIRAGISTERLAEYGRIFAEASPEARARAFPDSSAGLTPETGYGLAELQQDAPQIARDIAGMPQVRAVELTPGREPSDLPAAGSDAASAARAAGWGTTIVHAPTPPADTDPLPASLSAAFAAGSSGFAALPPVLASGTEITIRAESFYCEKESTELSVDDELYFAFIAFDKSHSTSWLSPTIENVDAGERHNFPFPNTIWSRSLAPGSLVVAVDVWEEDSGDHRDEIKGALSQAASSLLDQLQDNDGSDLAVATLGTAFDLLDENIFSPIAQAFSAGFFTLVQAMINWSHDDHVGSHNFVFTQEALLNLATTSFGWGAFYFPTVTSQEALIDGSSEGEARIRLKLTGWGFNPIRRVKLTCAGSGKALSVHGGSTENDANVVQWPYHAGDHQHWYLQSVAGDAWRLINAKSLQALSVYGGSTDDGANVDQWPYEGTANQLWTPKPVNDNVCELVNKRSGKALSVYGGSTDDGANVVQWPYHAGDHQHWRIEDV
ncbi:RICIN domain-containing protein [Streptomyces sp. NPDC051907]|uniref:RICIN domain-containing protein n=1 Tax=Streptomyces sp. NPDC051907 TaxID=3155284 RepID=UPI0034278298